MIYIFLADGFEEVEAITPLDILRRAGEKVMTVGVGGGYITGSHGVTVKTDITIDKVRDDYKMLIFPGGMPGADNLQKNSEVIRLIKDAARRGKYLAAICAAPKIFGALGLLRGKNATSFPEYHDELEGAHILDKPVVVDGNIITAKAAGAAAEFGFMLAALLCGEEESGALREKMFFYG
ncbi:MAG: Chaperone protein YajL [Firmicutes bacterium ADurb.Bin193]|nr:MAG: Chaperone protein YajL [Firmicutes bacterium ADurb.Bin193]